MLPIQDENEDLEHLSSTKFKWPDYVVFSTMLAMSAAIGIFYGCFRRQKTTKEFLMASSSMGTFPTAMSLTASFMSAIILLGTPAEIYSQGTMYFDLTGGYLFAMLSAAYLYAPVFYNLQVTSVYEYLEKRFSRFVRMLASFLAFVQLAIYMSIVVYAPSLALAQMTGINVYVSVTWMFVICIFYTALGGMRAVMVTDTLQILIMISAQLIIVVKGVQDIGGHSAVWEAGLDGSRIEFFNFNLDPRTRHTVWGLVIGGYFTWIALYGTNQAQVQRYLSVSSLKQAQRAIWINFFSLSLLLSICCYAGLVLYAKYRFCDPLRAGRIDRPDQIFPLYVMETVGSITGLPGLFVAGVFSGALSTVSSGINALSALCLEDFVRTIHPKMSERSATITTKICTVVFGLFSFGLVFIAAQMDSVLQAANSIFGMIGGPLLGLFTLGMFFPWATNKGAVTGILISITLMFWLGIGTNIAVLNSQLVQPKLPISIDECAFNITSTFKFISVPTGESGGILEVYRVSYIWYSAIGSLTVIVVGLIVSFLTGKQNSKTLNPKLISPALDALMNRLFSSSFRKRINWDLGSLFEQEELEPCTGGVKMQFMGDSLLMRDDGIL